MPPTTVRAWNSLCLAVEVKYQSVRGTLSGVSLIIPIILFITISYGLKNSSMNPGELLSNVATLFNCSSTLVELNPTNALGG